MLGGVVETGWAQSRLNRPPPRYVELSPPDQKAGAEILRQVRDTGLDGDYYLEFVLRVLPRRGEERRVPGRMWGGRRPAGPVTRLALWPEGGGEGGESRLLVQGGARPAAWSWAGGEGVTPAVVVDEGALFEPLAGTNLTAFDLQMPYLYWPEFVYEGKVRVNDRPTEAFLLYPPATIEARRPELAGIRVYLDAQYNALVRAEQIGAQERVLKSMRVVELKKIGERWIVKAVEVRDETTRDKTRFVVTAAGLGRDFAGGTFEPGMLPVGLAAPADLTRVGE